MHRPTERILTVEANASVSTQRQIGFNGLIKLSPGPNRFGGTLQILAGPGGIGGSKFTLYRLLGGPLMNYPPAALENRQLVLSPIGAMTPARVEDVTGSSMIGWASTGFMSSVFYDVMLFHNGAGPFTTGMLTVKVTMNGNPPVRSIMLTGYDNRTPLGDGNIQVVSGLLINTYNSIGPGSFPLGWQMRIHVIPEPTPSLGLAAGAFGLLWVALLRARRQR